MIILLFLIDRLSFWTLVQTYRSTLRDWQICLC